MENRTHYQFFEKDGDDFLIPHSDPWEYETPMDLIFDTPEDAYASLEPMGIVDTYYEGDGTVPEGWMPEGWVLCRVTTTEV